MDSWVSGSMFKRLMVGFLVPCLGDGWLGFWFHVQEVNGWLSSSMFRRWMVGFLVLCLGDERMNIYFVGGFSTAFIHTV